MQSQAAGEAMTVGNTCVLVVYWFDVGVRVVFFKKD